MTIMLLAVVEWGKMPTFFCFIIILIIISIIITSPKPRPHVPPVHTVPLT